MNSNSRVPAPINEPVLSYAPGTQGRTELKAQIAALSGKTVEVPLIIGGEELRTGDTFDVLCPHNHSHIVARAHRATPEDVDRAVENALAARVHWSEMPFDDRAAIFLRAAELLAGPWRQRLNAATVVGQGKTAHQTEIDAATELIDFLRFNVHYAQEIYDMQLDSDDGMWNRMEYRPLEGFIYAISPFNFSAIGGNLTGAPALMGNVVVWKPSDSAVLSGYLVAKLFEEAGLPPGVINFIPGDPEAITERLLAHRALAGIHFTGSTTVFRSLWSAVGSNIQHYNAYPRLVGETGGKDFIVAHPSADAEALTTAIIRGAFEYQGQKCSAASRAYIPESIWGRIRTPLVETTESIAMGDPADFTNFMGAVIHERAFEKITGYIERAKASDDVDVIAGGEYDRSTGWFIRPTILLSKTPDYESMCEEIFGPVITIYVYPDDEWDEVLDLVDGTSQYALTGAVFARDRSAVREAHARLRNAAGNFYINDKPTGAVVGQQPFGGARASGTNDKAGSALNLLRWVSPRTVKETLVSPTDYRYPFMEAGD